MGCVGGSLKDKNNVALQHVTNVEYDFIVGYLIRSKLLTNTMCCSVEGQQVLIPSGEMTKDGICVVESFIDKCLLKIETFYDVCFNNSLSYIDKIKQLIMVWDGNLSLYNTACEMLVSILWNNPLKPINDF